MPARSKSQQRLFGMVHAYQKGKLDDAPERIKDIAAHISEEDAEHFAKTKHKKLPEKKAYMQGFMNKLAEYGIAKKADDNGSTRKKIGLGLLGVGMGVPLAMTGHNFLKFLKFKKLIAANAFKSTKEVDDYILKHLKEVGKKLPKYKWANPGDGTLGIGHIFSDAEIKDMRKTYKNPNLPLYSSQTIPVYDRIGDLTAKINKANSKLTKESVLWRLLNFLQNMQRRVSGPHFDPDLGYITTHSKGYLHPKILMHELGHFQDAINGTLNAADRHNSAKSLKEWWKWLKNPDSSPLLQTEIRAWDNAGIAPGDVLRETALDTYRIGSRVKSLAPVFAVPQTAGGILYASGKSKENKNKGWWK